MACLGAGRAPKAEKKKVPSTTVRCGPPARACTPVGVRTHTSRLCSQPGSRSQPGGPFQKSTHFLFLHNHLSPTLFPLQTPRPSVQRAHAPTATRGPHPHPRRRPKAILFTPSGILVCTSCVCPPCESPSRSADVAVQPGAKMPLLYPNCSDLSARVEKSHPGDRASAHSRRL